MDMKIQKIDEAELFDEDVLIDKPDMPLELEEKHKLDYGS